MGTMDNKRDRMQACWFLLKETGNVLKMNREKCYGLLKYFFFQKLSPKKKPGSWTKYAPHNDVSVNDGPHIRRWSHKIIIL